MKKLILIILLFIAGIATKAQTYQIDSIATFQHVDDAVYITTAEDVIITIRNKVFTIKGGLHDFQAIIKDTLYIKPIYTGQSIATYVIVNVKDTADERMLQIIHYFGEPYTVAVWEKNTDKLIVYHVKNELIDGQARKQTYFRDWLKASLGR